MLGDVRVRISTAYVLCVIVMWAIGLRGAVGLFRHWGVTSFLSLYTSRIKFLCFLCCVISVLHCSVTLYEGKSENKVPSFIATK
jgi:hypothetical protein